MQPKSPIVRFLPYLVFHTNLPRYRTLPYLRMPQKCSPFHFLTGSALRFAFSRRWTFCACFHLTQAGVLLHSFESGSSLAMTLGGRWFDSRCRAPTGQWIKRPGLRQALPLGDRLERSPANSARLHKREPRVKQTKKKPFFSADTFFGY